MATLTRRESDRLPREQKGPRPSESKDPQHLAEEVSRQRTVAQAVLELKGSFLYADDPILTRLSIGNEGAEVIPNPVKAPRILSITSAFRPY